MISTRNKALLALTVLLVGWLAGAQTATVSPPLVQARRDVWQLLPLPVPVDATTRAALVSTAPQWGADKAAAAGANAAPEQLRWRLAGVYGAGKQGGALILFDGPNNPPQRLKVGEKLPSGHLIDAVDGNQVCIRIGKKLYRFGVERRE